MYMFIEINVNKWYYNRRGSRRNGDRFPKQQTPKAQGSRGGPGARFPGKFFFLRVIHKNLTDFRKTVETGLDPRLYKLFETRLKIKRFKFSFGLYIFVLGILQFNCSLI